MSSINEQQTIDAERQRASMGNNQTSDQRPTNSPMTDQLAHRRTERQETIDEEATKASMETNWTSERKSNEETDAEKHGRNRKAEAVDGLNRPING